MKIKKYYNNKKQTSIKCGICKQKFLPYNNTQKICMKKKCRRVKKNLYMSHYYKTDKGKEYRRTYQQAYNQLPTVKRKIKIYNKKYNQQPQVKKRVSARNKIYNKKNRQDISNKAKQRYHNDDQFREKVLTTGKKNRSKPKNKKRIKKYQARPDVKAKNNINASKYYYDNRDEIKRKQKIYRLKKKDEKKNKNSI